MSNVQVIINSNDVLNQLKTTDFIDAIIGRTDKQEFLNAFTKEEIVAYINLNNIIDAKVLAQNLKDNSFILEEMITEDVVAALIENGKINLETVLGKIAMNRIKEKGLI